MSRIRRLNPAIIAVLPAATLWGTLGVYYDVVDRHVDVDRLTVVTLRGVGATVVLVLWWGWRDRTVFRIERCDLPAFVTMGVVSVTAFYIFLIYAFVHTSVAVGTLLLYTAPAFVTVGASVFLGEQLTRTKLAALASSFIGCGLVVQITHPGAVAGNATGILLGLSAAVCYACYKPDRQADACSLSRCNSADGAYDLWCSCTPDREAGSVGGCLAISRGDAGAGAGRWNRHLGRAGRTLHVRIESTAIERGEHSRDVGTGCRRIVGGDRPARASWDHAIDRCELRGVGGDHSRSCSTEASFCSDHFTITKRADHSIGPCDLP